LAIREDAPSRRIAGGAGVRSLAGQAAARSRARPLEPPTQPITDDSNRRLLGPLHALAGELGYRVDEREDSGAADGWCDHDNKLIVVAGHLAGNAKAGVLLHELAHALGIGYADYGRARAEVLVDAVTYIVCAGAGLEVSVESVPYVAGWGQEDAVAAVHQFAGTIDTVARRVEHAINPESAHGGPEVLQAV